MEFIYYLHDPKQMLQSIHDDWLSNNGWAVIGIDHYAEHEESLGWPEALDVHMSTFSEAEWIQMWRMPDLLKSMHGEPMPLQTNPVRWLFLEEKSGLMPQVHPLWTAQSNVPFEEWTFLARIDEFHWKPFWLFSPVGLATKCAIQSKRLSNSFSASSYIASGI